MAGLQNWAGNIAFGAAAVERPRSIAQLQDIIRRAGKARVLGSGHSFNPIADTSDTLISLAGLPRSIEIDSTARTVRLDGGATYADLAPLVHRAGFALANVASLPHITVAGAVNTATHGSGNANANLAAAVAGLELLTASGEIVHYRRGDPDFDGAVVGFGALGIVTALTLDLVPGFDIRQTVYRGLPIATLLENVDAVMGGAYSVSLFTNWHGDTIDQVWVKALDEGSAAPDSFFGALPANGPCHPIPGMDGNDCTTQSGIPGPWHERLFHFPIGHKASAGAELQSEHFVSRADAPAAIAALHAVQDQFAPALFIGEIRTIAADTLWLSTAQGMDSIGFHFTWRPDWAPTIAAVSVVEAALAPFRPRPHWAKLFTMTAKDIRARYERMGDFQRLALRLDPAGKFRNPFLDELIFAPE